MTATTTATIRPARPGDLDGIAALLKASDLPTIGVAESLDGFLVGESDGDIVGVVGLETCCSAYALLRSTAVAPAWRGRGLGRQLVERAIASAESRGF
jgi:amino-acid N-acetyltransferase